jgi:hypothetical protein
VAAGEAARESREAVTREVAAAEAMAVEAACVRQGCKALSTALSMAPSTALRFWRFERLLTRSVRS